ncbi:hypothetical protein PQJ75_28965 [Rhodoplanes sp. TEM]|uniref:DUF58 domain-containing protein n=1 Tax=Rhodoplanes tepidamans TaxID=200616 RepID=A0ABT5JJS9_RHOTP|nr:MULTISPECIES: hypothetical protein [Rhodoplanes]MDC7789851.1 hypothetical protein [Rhodoplanes tepidamans]MDC7987785.1 hypothetical protein [Rhodoplanes sp. TEM]MDQ0358502.1 hypothetical protein [Rhodoplanes tepidamans]
MSRGTVGAGRQWRWPIALAASTLLGLVAALVGEGGVWWAVSWAALAVPLLVILRCVVPRAPAGGGPLTPP